MTMTVLDLPSALDAVGAIQWAKEAEQRGATSLCLGDSRADPIVLLALLATAARTSELRVRVSRLVGRSPLLLAKQLTAIDLLSNGRLVLIDDDAGLTARVVGAVASEHRPLPVRGSLKFTADLQEGTSY